MTLRLKWYERLLGWVLLHFEVARGFGCFHEINTAAMEWYLRNDNLFYGEVCRLMRNYIHVRMARELEKERRNG